MKYIFKNLVFEGGGVKGIAYGGALKVLEQKELLGSIERVAGTSAGAINATLLSLGYSIAEVSDIIAKTNFADFEDHSGFFPKNVYRLINAFGWNKGDAFTEWLGALIKKKTGKADFTFGDLEKVIDEGSEPTFKFLYVASTNLSQQKYTVLSHETHKETPIKEAVRMSMSIPLYFKAYKKKDNVYVDGGVSYNYPINIFDRKKYVSNPTNGNSSYNYFKTEDGIFNYETLGFRLDSKEVIDYAQRDWAPPPSRITGIKSYLGGLVSFMMEMANKAHLHQNDWNRTIFIDTLDVGTTDFDLTDERISALLKSGQDCTNKYFEWRDGDPEWSKMPN